MMRAADGGAGDADEERVKATLGTAALGRRQAGAPRKIQNVA